MAAKNEIYLRDHKRYKYTDEDDNYANLLSIGKIGGMKLAARRNSSLNKFDRNASQKSGMSRINSKENIARNSILKSSNSQIMNTRGSMRPAQSMINFKDLQSNDNIFKTPNQYNMPPRSKSRSHSALKKHTPSDSKSNAGRKSVLFGKNEDSHVKRQIFSQSYYLLIFSHCSRYLFKSIFEIQAVW